MTVTVADRPFPVGEPVAVHPDFTVCQFQEGWLYYTPQGEQLAMTGNYDRASLWLPANTVAPRQDVRVLLLLRLAVECRLAQNGAVSLHSACVIKDGRAVAFTGVSGMGKSTRAAQWVEALNAQWLSGDRPAVSVSEATVYGMPWDGKEQLFCAASAPLAAILEVRRGSVTQLRRLTRSQARRILMKQCFLPMWDSNTSSAIMGLIWVMTETVPIYRLTCDRTAQAALETFQILYQKPELILPEDIDLKIKEGFALRKFADEYMVMPVGDNVASFSGAVVLNEVAAFVFEKLQAPLSRDDLLTQLCAEFEVTTEVAGRDLDALLNTFRDYGMLQEQP